MLFKIYNFSNKNKQTKINKILIIKVSAVGCGYFISAETNIGTKISIERTFRNVRNKLEIFSVKSNKFCILRN